MSSYHKILLKDPNFKEFYANNICRAIFTFPKFRRNYSKNYKLVQSSFKKRSRKRKTIVFDIDETLVYSTTKRSEVRVVDDIITIKMAKYGAFIKAFISFRPYVMEMLEELSSDFEIILYTCGTANYA